MRAMIEQEMGDKDIILADIERLTKLKGELLKTAKGQYARKVRNQALREEKKSDTGGSSQRQSRFSFSLAGVQKQMAKSEVRTEIKAEVKPINPAETGHMSGQKDSTSLR